MDDIEQELTPDAGCKNLATVLTEGYWGTPACPVEFDFDYMYDDVGNGDENVDGRTVGLRLNQSQYEACADSLTVSGGPSV